jgi:hypothetical protein
VRYYWYLVSRLALKLPPLGPPGTGKSYLGVVMVRALLIIREFWVKVRLRLQKTTGIRLGLEERNMFAALGQSISLAKCPTSLRA